MEVLYCYTAFELFLLCPLELFIFVGLFLDCLLGFCPVSIKAALGSATYKSWSSSCDKERQKLKLHSILDELYIKKAKGTYVRSRVKWMEEGGKLVHNILIWKKRRQERNSINSLIVNQVEHSDHNTIAN